MLAAKGLVAFLRVTAALVTIAPSRFPASAPTPGLPGPVEAEIIRIWSRMVLAHAP